METILYNISQVLGVTIIHSLWQGLVVYFILRIVFAGPSSLTATKKYNLAIGAMVAITVCFIYTLLTEISAYSWVTLKKNQLLPLLPYLNLPTNSHYQPAWYYKISGYLPFICAVYFTGLTINLARLAMEWSKIRQIRLSVLPAEQMQRYVNTFAQKLGIKKHIQLKFSELIDVPCMIGYFKPLVLLPVSICTNLSADEVEAILLHELSHIKRNDYLVNLLQQFIGVLLFFNPFTQLITRIVNQERENGCDDLVVEKTGEPLIYAQALIKLEEVRKTNFKLALAATGQKFHLLNRIERIMKTKKHIGSIRHLMIALFLLAGTLSCIAWFNPKTATPKTLLTDSTNYSLQSDTTKYKHKSKTVAKSQKNKLKAGKQKTGKTEQSYSNTYWGDDAPDSVKRFFNSAEWKSQMDAVRKQGLEMQKHFNSAEWKAQMAQMKKQFNSPEWKKQMEAMSKQGLEMQKHFNSAEWKSQMDLMKKQFDSPEWKNQILAMAKQSEEMSKHFNSVEWKNQVKELEKQGKLMQKQFDSPEWKNQFKEMEKQGKLMQKQFDSPEWKNQMKDLTKQFDSPEWKNQMKELTKQFDSKEWKKMKRNGHWVLTDTTGDVRIYRSQKDTTEKEDQ
ncbi:M56 family metallopeptidase [Mucilaginibacter flavidus]|uniref:M56 family metallopeptidase n=1 Tax=Mucilaginibacter flavidus TaxID=2949309 RepID=UPI002092568A|nr:M56 family metallopeptidase [Mucilaginibacter flavidus]MCO5946104.1 M48 family metalloprotease [Mucilaginibacter flavidus]